MAKRDKRKMVVKSKEVLYNLPEFLMLKKRRGGTVVLTCGSESRAKELFEVLKSKFKKNDFHSVLPKESAHALRGALNGESYFNELWQDSERPFVAAVDSCGDDNRPVVWSRKAFNPFPYTGEEGHKNIDKAFNELNKQQEK